MIFQDVNDMLVNDPQLNLVPADEANVVAARTVEGYDQTLVFVTNNSIKLHQVITIVPLAKALTGGSGYLSSLCEQVNASAKVDFHHFLTTCKLGNILVKGAIAVNGDRHERSPAIVPTLVLNKFEGHCGGSNQEVKTNVIAGRSQCNEPTLLICLKREIPTFFEGACDVVENW